MEQSIWFTCQQGAPLHPSRANLKSILLSTEKHQREYKEQGSKIIAIESWFE